MSCYGGQGQGLLHTRPSHLLGEIQKTTNDAVMIKIMMMKRLFSTARSSSHDSGSTIILFQILTVLSPIYIVRCFAL